MSTPFCEFSIPNEKVRENHIKKKTSSFSRSSKKEIHAGRVIAMRVHDNDRSRGCEWAARKKMLMCRRELDTLGETIGMW